MSSQFISNITMLTKAESELYPKKKKAESEFLGASLKPERPIISKNQFIFSHKNKMT